MRILLSFSILGLLLGLITPALAETVLPPMKQQDMVDDLHEIQCKSHLTLIFKDKSWTPACVKPSSVDKLIERGWASDHDPNHMMMNNH